MSSTKISAENPDVLGRFTIVTRETEAGEKPITLSVHRRVVEPCHFDGGIWVPTDLSSEPEEIQAYALALWTPEAISAFKSAFVPPEPVSPADRIIAPRLQGAELLTVTDGEITGFDNIVGFAFAADVGDFYIFFAKEFASMAYSYSVQANGCTAHVTEREVGYMRILCSDPATGSAADPTEISIQLYSKAS